MEIRKLNQFGAVMSFAIGLEEQLISYFEKLSDQSESDDEIKGLSNKSRKRKRNLVRSRQENVTEITLEPIEGLSPETYTLTLTEFSRSELIKNLETMKQFYGDAGPKINVRESSKLFARCLKEYNNLQILN